MSIRFISDKRHKVKAGNTALWLIQQLGLDDNDCEILISQYLNDIWTRHRFMRALTHKKWNGVTTLQDPCQDDSGFWKGTMSPAIQLKRIENMMLMGCPLPATRQITSIQCGDVTRGGSGQLQTLCGYTGNVKPSSGNDTFLFRDVTTKAKRSCSKCHSTDHNARGCPCFGLTKKQLIENSIEASSRKAGQLLNVEDLTVEGQYKCWGRNPQVLAQTGHEKRTAKVISHAQKPFHLTGPTKLVIGMTHH